MQSTRKGARCGALRWLALALCAVLALQIVSLSARSSRGPGLTVVGSAWALCVADSHDASNPGPGQTRHVHGEHCTACDLAPTQGKPPRGASVITLSHAPAISTVPRNGLPGGEPPPKLAGWVSSWSSRAPPLFS